MTGRPTRRIPENPRVVYELRRLIARQGTSRFHVGDGLEPVDICGLGGTWLLGRDAAGLLVEIHPR